MSIEELVHLRRARDLIDREYARPLDVPAMARAALLSPAHFTRRYRETYGETPYQHLLTRRVERARALLRVGELSVTEVCLAVGFSSLGTFSSRFRELTGHSPSEYRASTEPVGGVPGCMVPRLSRLTRSSRNEEARAARPVLR